LCLLALGLSERRFKLINEISKSEEKKKIIVTIEEVEKAMQKLNSGKSADDYGITAQMLSDYLVL
jgi:hypothetical protein